MERLSRQHLILTLPLWGNYGGILQAYALWRTLARLRPETAALVEYPRPLPGTALMRFIKQRARLLQLVLGFFPPGMRLPQCVWQPVADRMKNCMKTADLADGYSGSAVASPASATWIVGSDQVWRADYARDIRSLPFFFLDFLPQEVRRRSIAYAASFGTDEWLGTPQETAACRELLQQFKAVSVREKSGIRLCRELFGVEAVRMPDPTLLPEPRDYEELMGGEILPGAYMAAYLLDESAGSQSILKAASARLGLPIRHLMPRAAAGRLCERFPLSVPHWLRSIREAEYVVTDSFHGCVFALLFNKPFLCLGNAKRGGARFETLLDTFCLQSRLVEDEEQLQAALESPIDWDAVMAILERERACGLDFLRDNLG